MPKGDRPLLRNTAFLYMLTFVKLGAPLITLPYLTRILSVETYGFVAYTKAYASYVQLLIDFGFLLSATAAVALRRSTPHEVGRVTGDTLLEKVILAALASIGTAIAITVLPVLSLDPLFVWLHVLSCAASILVLDFLYRGLERMEYAALPFVVAKAVSVGLTFFLVRSEADLLMLPLLDAASNILAGAMSFFFLKKVRVSLSISGPPVWIRDLRESSVYFFSNFATTIFGVLTTLVVGLMLPLADVAFWSIAMMFVATAKALYGPISSAIYPHMVQYRDLALVTRIAGWSSLPLLVFGGLLILFGPELIALAFGSGYSFAGEVLFGLLPVLIFSYYSMLYGWPALGPIGKAREVTWTTVIAALMQVLGIVGLLALDRFDLIALAVVCSASEGFLLVSRGALVAKHRLLFGKAA